MKLIVGLGNPDKKYENTRHNCGFMALDYYINKNKLTYKKKYNALMCEQIINNEKIILVKPQTYMNLSGNSVVKFVNFYNIKEKDILIIYDDINYSVGKFKIKRDGSSGGHNGIKNIIDCLNSNNISRIKIGIGNEMYDNNLINYVLDKFNKEDKSKIDELLPTISNIIEDFTQYDIDYLMQKYNRNE